MFMALHILCKSPTIEVVKKSNLKGLYLKSFYITNIKIIFR